jgi:hypothetical protein
MKKSGLQQKTNVKGKPSGRVKSLAERYREICDLRRKIDKARKPAARFGMK